MLTSLTDNNRTVQSSTQDAVYQEQIEEKIECLQNEINATNEQVSTNTQNITTNASDIDNLEGRVQTLETHPNVQDITTCKVCGKLGSNKRLALVHGNNTNSNVAILKENGQNGTLWTGELNVTCCATFCSGGIRVLGGDVIVGTDDSNSLTNAVNKATAAKATAEQAIRDVAAIDAALDDYKDDQASCVKSTCVEATNATVSSVLTANIINATTTCATSSTAGTVCTSNLKMRSKIYAQDASSWQYFTFEVDSTETLLLKATTVLEDLSEVDYSVFIQPGLVTYNQEAMLAVKSVSHDANGKVRVVVARPKDGWTYFAISDDGVAYNLINGDHPFSYSDYAPQELNGSVSTSAGEFAVPDGMLRADKIHTDVIEYEGMSTDCLNINDRLTVCECPGLENQVLMTDSEGKTVWAYGVTTGNMSNATNPYKVVTKEGVQSYAGCYSDNYGIPHYPITHLGTNACAHSNLDVNGNFEATSNVGDKIKLANNCVALVNGNCDCIHVSVSNTGTGIYGKNSKVVAENNQASISAGSSNNSACVRVDCSEGISIAAPEHTDENNNCIYNTEHISKYGTCIDSLCNYRPEGSPGPTILGESSVIVCPSSTRICNMGYVENEGYKRSCVDVCKDSVNITTSATNITGNASIGGDLNVTGTICYQHSEHVVTEDEVIQLRDGATSAIQPGCYAGIVVENYDGNNNTLTFGVDNAGTAIIGTAPNNMEALLTRDDASCLCDGGVLVWDATNKMAKTSAASCVDTICSNNLFASCLCVSKDAYDTPYLCYVYSEGSYIPTVAIGRVGNAYNSAGGLLLSDDFASLAPSVEFIENSRYGGCICLRQGSENCRDLVKVGACYNTNYRNTLVGLSSDHNKAELTFNGCYNNCFSLASSFIVDKDGGCYKYVDNCCSANNCIMAFKDATLCYSLDDGCNWNGIRAGALSVNNCPDWTVCACYRTGSLVELVSNCCHISVCASNLSFCTCSVITHLNCCNCDYNVPFVSAGDCYYKSGSCPLTYNPATGVLTAKCVCGSDQYHHIFAQPGNQTTYARIDLVNTSENSGIITGSLYSDRFTIRVYDVGSNNFGIISFTSTGTYGGLRVAKEGTSTIWLSYFGWRPVEIQSNVKFTPYTLTTTAPSGVTWTSPTVETVACATTTTCLMSDSTNYVKAEGQNQLNTYTCNGLTSMRLNYAGGAACTIIGNGAGNGGYGTLIATNVIATCFCGKATSVDCFCYDANNFINIGCDNGTVNCPIVDSVFIGKNIVPNNTAYRCERNMIAIGSHSSYFNIENLGSGTITIGNNLCTDCGNYIGEAVLIGNNIIAGAPNTTAIGTYSIVTGSCAIAIGTAAKSCCENSIAIGTEAIACDACTAVIKIGTTCWKFTASNIYSSTGSNNWTRRV